MATGPIVKTECITISLTEYSKEYWLSRPFVDENLRSDASGADILVLPREGFKSHQLPVFADGTGELVSDLERAASQNGLECRILIREESYTELVLYHDAVTVATIFVAKLMALPIVIGVIGEWVKRKIWNKGCKDIECRIVLPLDNGETALVEYKGGADGFEKLMMTVPSLLESTIATSSAKSITDATLQKMRVDISEDTGADLPRGTNTSEEHKGRRDS